MSLGKRMRSKYQLNLSIKTYIPYENKYFKRKGKNGGFRTYIKVKKNTVKKKYEIFDYEQKNLTLYINKLIWKIMFVLSLSKDGPFSIPRIINTSKKSITYVKVNGIRLDELKSKKSEYKKACKKRNQAKEFMEKNNVFHNDLYDRNCFWNIEDQELIIIDWDEATLFEKSDKGRFWALNSIM